jgi:hypothetical protein
MKERKCAGPSPAKLPVQLPEERVKKAMEVVKKFPVDTKMKRDPKQVWQIVN